MHSEMRAETTVGLDLECLENLRIFNGYEIKKESEKRLSLEVPSSSEEYNNESDTSQHDTTPSHSSLISNGKPKCGRPANPIPRHKRDTHIQAEYKRRDKIQKGFDCLLTLVPELRGVSEKESKAKMLFKTADYCRRLKSECGNSQTELTALRQELDFLGTEIQEIQDKLPCQGIETARKCDDVFMDQLYDQYVKEETERNWKFWLFGYFMRPLYDSFKQTTSGKQNSQEFNKTVFQWVQNTLSLSNLRKGFLDGVRMISKHTSIMTHPENLQQEARSKVTDHCIGAKQEHVPDVLTPPIVAHAPTKAPVSSAICTPLSTPTPTPPRTPTVSRRSSKREIPRSTESRSRSNSPAPEEINPKRRSNYRSRSGRRGGDVCKGNMEYATPVANPNLPLLSRLLTSPQMSHTSQFSAVTMATASSDAHMVACHQSNIPTTLSQFGAVTTATASSDTHMFTRYQDNVPSTLSQFVTVTMATASSDAHMVACHQSNIPKTLSQFGTVTTATTPSDADMVSCHQNSVSSTVNHSNSLNNSEEQLIATFVESLISVMKPIAGNPISEPDSESSTSFVSTSTHPSLTQATVDRLHHVETSSSTQYMNNLTDVMRMEIVDVSARNVFIPLSTSSVISNSSILFACEPVTGQINTGPSQFEGSPISDYQPMDLFPSVSTSDSLLTDMHVLASEHSDMVPADVPMLASVHSEKASPETYSLRPSTEVPCTSANVISTEDSCILNPDEDSLTGLLGIDVLDVNSILNFFSEDNHNQS